MAISGSDSGLQAFLRAVRKPRDEAQLTQVIAAAAKLDETFSADLVRLFLNAAPNRDAAHLLGEPPAALRCRAEVQVYDAAGSDRGRADLIFDDEGGSFSLLAELKLASDYGETQLGRYSDAVDAFSQPRRGLIAATTLTPQTGEEAVAGHPRWLGSIRWFRVVDAMRELEHRDRLVKRTWVAWLDLLRTEGDFGPMDFDPRDVEGWARRDAAETFLFSALNELAEPRGSAERTVERDAVPREALPELRPDRRPLRSNHAVPGGIAPASVGERVMAAVDALELRRQRFHRRT